MTTNEKDLIKRLLDLTRPLAEAHHENRENRFLFIFEPIYRRNIFSLLAISELSFHPYFSEKVMMISRSMVEDLITVEYMLAFGKKRLARKFLRFVNIQAYQDITFIEKLGQDPLKMLKLTKEEYRDRVRKYKLVKKEFTHYSGNDMRSWIGHDIEYLLLELNKAIQKGKRLKLTQRDIAMINKAYLSGNTAAHFNPYGVLRYARSDWLDQISESDLRAAMLFSAACFIRFTTRYIDEIRYTYHSNEYEDISIKVKAIFNELDSQSENLI